MTVKKEVPIKILFDEHENKIIATEKESTISIDLKLATENRKRRVGVVTKSTRVLNVIRKRYKHLHIKSDSYGFNHHILDISKKFDTVVFTDEVSRFKIPRKFILENGKFLFFLQQGFERQIFVSLTQLEQFKVADVI